jgi:prepilin-type N-terminal cleavage/methylation domain-containing protein
MKKGFTLLELLIGITIFAMISGAVYTSLYLGIKVYKHQQQADSGIQEAMLCFQVLEKILFSTYISPEDENIIFQGSLEKMDFFRINNDRQLESVSFYLDSSGSEDSFDFLVARKKYLGSSTEPEESVEVINSSVRGLQFSYFDPEQQQWYEEWPDEQIVPSQVKIAIDFIAKEQGSRIMHLEKYVNIPVSLKIQIDEYAESG